MYCISATKCSSVGDWELSLDDAINVFEELIEAQNEYFTFGLCLNLKHYVIQSIHLEQHNQKDRLFFVIVEFLKTAPRRTWRVIVDALRVIEFSELAHKVEDKYLASPSQSDISSHQRLSRTAPFTGTFLVHNIPKSCNLIGQCEGLVEYLAVQGSKNKPQNPCKHNLNAGHAFSVGLMNPQSLCTEPENDAVTILLLLGGVNI